MNKLNKLKNLCKGEVIITFNEHRSSYQTVKEELIDYYQGYEVDTSVFKEMINRDEMICIRFYPNTPLNFTTVLHYDIDMAIDKCIEYFDMEINKKALSVVKEKYPFINNIKHVDLKPFDEDS